MIAADWTFEERLHERIDARRLIATRLSPRQRRVLCRTFLHGETLREVAAPDGVSPARVAQILAVALRRLQRSPQAPPRPAPATAPAPPGFDRAAFLRHMQGLIARREILARQAFEAERQVLDGLLESEQANAELKAKTAASLAKAHLAQLAKTLKAESIPGIEPVWDIFQAPPPPAAQNVEPWFDPARQPTREDLRCIAQYALGYFTAACGLGHGRDGLPDVGEHTIRVLCPRDADRIAEGMMRVKAAIPSSHRLSACLLDIPEGDMLCVTLGNRCVSLRVSSIEEGRRVAIEVTHGPAH